jgi:hypothetical protein
MKSDVLRALRLTGAIRFRPRATSSRPRSSTIQGALPGDVLAVRLDRAKGVAMSESPGERFATFTVRLRPMLGCVGAAPGFGIAPCPTG